jgi:collagenase-like PrtC family protease
MNMEWKFLENFGGYMIDYKIGCNFDEQLIDKIADLNEKYKDSARCFEFFGSDRSHAYLAARPDFRLPDIDKPQLEAYVKKSYDKGIMFNYTANTVFPGTKQELEFKKQEIIDYFKYLEDIGVYRITVSNPITLEFLREASKTMRVELSTTLHIDAVTQIKYYKEMYNIDKVCGSLLKNRSVKFLKNAAEYCNSNGIIYELMVNEFCGTGGDNYMAPCIYRDACYLCHATNHTKEDAESLNGFPMKYCMSSRETNQTQNWLRTRFVRPEDIKRYAEIGIKSFKITGRTGSTEYIVKMAEAYLGEKFNGNLLELWKPLQTIYSGESEIDYKHRQTIDNSKLDDFLNHWFKNPEFDCANEECGKTCKYCEEYVIRKQL